MDKAEILKLLDVVIEALKKDPTQFHYNVNVRSETTGLRVEQTGSGIGYISSVTGQGIGTQISVSGTTGNVQLVRRGLDEAIRRDVNSAIQLLEELKAELGKGAPSKSRLEKILEGLKTTVLTPALVATVQAAIYMALTG